jgi:hypothetical protein
MQINTLTASIFFTLFFFACTSSEKEQVQPALTGHQRMVAMLDSIEQNADPMRCYNLNKRRAEFWLEQFNQAPPEQKASMRFNYATQLLKSGRNEDAIMEFQQLIKFSGDQLNEQTKILYELLAVAYLRLGETANCIENHNPYSCSIPLKGEGIYTYTSGSKQAIAVYERILDQFPDDLQSRWLYNLAHMTLGQWPEGARRQFLLPENVFRSSDFSIDLEEVGIAKGVDVRGISGGACIDDFNNDGYPDLFASSYGNGDQLRFFVNSGEGRFSERTVDANLKGIDGGLNVVQADYDNDGDKDLLVLRGAWMVGGTFPNSLLRNNGDGTFSDVTIEAGLLSFHPTQSASWADYDGDGWLDVYIANETWDMKEQHSNELYRNNGDGTFTNMAGKYGVDYVSVFKACHWGDVNNDQRPDLYISNLLGENILLVNGGGTSFEEWSFYDVTQQAGVGRPMSSFPAFFFDYNNDGKDDILVSGYTEKATTEGSFEELVSEYLGKPIASDPMRIYRNNGDGTFSDQTETLGMKKTTFAMGNNVGDLDNDGWVDLIFGTGLPDFRSLVPNRIFHNNNGNRFRDVSMGRFGHIQKGHGIALADIDNDGDLDIYIVTGGALEGDLANNLLYKNSGNDNNYLVLELRGTTSNRDAIGAKIALTVMDPDGSTRRIFTTVNSGGSFGASALRRTIGLGKATAIPLVEILWPKPGVPVSSIKDVPVNSAYLIEEGNPELQVLEMKPIDF